ncbi:ComEC/Rec2 family competence protein [Terrabacter aerolatus]|uniref:Membrane protein n=2 Tax=Terrabacter aerolatus TaxID=422442 RepID=A0A512CY15_9MICO|nr:ComEC/Rec2 family competence protein [Terrabacter aerolatus]GEO29101.1 membrane protein [Terrabacter aerolatus]
MSPTASDSSRSPGSPGSPVSPASAARREREQAPRGPSLVVLTGRETVRRVRPRSPSRLDLRLLVPVVVAWPVTAFWGLVAPVWLVTTAAAVALATGVLTAVAGTARDHGCRGRGRVMRSRGAAGRGSWSGHQGLRAVTSACALLGLLLGAAAGHRAVRTAGPVESLASERAVVTLDATVAAEPRAVRGPGPAAAEHPPAAAITVVRLDVSQVSGRGRTTHVSAPVLVIGRGAAWSALRWHDSVQLVVRLGPAEPGDDVVAVATPKGPVQVVAGPGGVFEAADVVRDRFRAATSGLWPDARGLVPALVVGDTSQTPPDLTAVMLATGLSHLSAVSGSNVTFVLAAVLWLCGLVGVRRRWRPPVAALGLLGFVVLARPEPSVVRAAVMGLVGLLALSTSRRRAGVPALAGAIAVLLVWDPWLARSYGFALSSVATLGLLVLAGPWGRTIARRLPGPLKPLGPVLAIPVAAQAVCAPLVVPLQGSVSFVAVLANLLAAPFVAPTTLLGVGVALVAVVWVPGAAWLAWAAALPAQAIAVVARWSADLPFGSISWGDSAGAAVLLAVLTAGVVATAPWAWHRSRHRPTVAVAVVVLTAGLGLPTAPIAWPPPGWALIACDVGQGDGLVVDNGSGHVVVIDAGPDPEPMRSCLDRLGATNVDLLVLTHYHADHVGGLAAVLELPVAEIRASPVLDPPAEATRVARLAAAARVPMGELRAGQRVTVGSVAADVWWPARRIDAGSVPNNGSVVLTLHVHGMSILLAGDIEREAAAQVLQESARDPGRWGRIDVLKVAHHGSSNRDDRLLDRVAGRLAVISVGEGNDYGHPAPATLTALQERGFEIHRTDLEGDVAVVADGGQVRAVGR